jgi:hypothetical protein
MADFRIHDIKTRVIKPEGNLFSYNVDPLRIPGLMSQASAYYWSSFTTLIYLRSFPKGTAETCPEWLTSFPKVSHLSNLPPPPVGLEACDM